METATTDQMLPLIVHNLGIGFYPKKMAELALAKGDVLPDTVGRKAAT